MEPLEDRLLLSAVSDVGIPTQNQAAVPFVLTNQTGQQVNFTMYGIDNSTGQWSYFSGTASSGNTFSGTLVPAQQLGAGHNLPTYSFTGPSATLLLPTLPSGISSAAIVMTVGTIVPRITVASNFTLPRPAPSNPALVNATTNPYYDFIEFTLDGNHTLFINTTQVDQFGFPMTLSASPAPAGAPVGVTPGISRDAIFQTFVTFLNQETDSGARNYLPLLQTASTGSPYRIIAPGQYLAMPGKSTDPLASYFDSALQSFFTSPPPLTLISNGISFSGRTSTHNPVAAGDFINGAPDTNPADNHDFNVIDFVGSGALAGQHFFVYSPIGAPSWVHTGSVGEQVFANNGVFADNGVRFNGLQSSVLGDLENQVVSALTRGIANLPKPTQYANTSAFWTDPAQAFPAGQKENLYAKFLHTGAMNGTPIFISGRVYAFPYSDQGNQAAFFAVPNPTSVSVTLGPWCNSQMASPSITNAAAPTVATVGALYSYQFSASGSPTPILRVNGLPAWLTFNASTGLLTGTPTSSAAGTSAIITLNASNGVLPNAAMTFTLNVASVVAPTLAVSPSSLTLGTTTAGTVGSAQNFTVSGSQLTANLVLSAPTGVQLSLDGTTWNTSLNLTPSASGTVASTTIRTRIAASASVGSVSSSINVTSSGATAKTVAVSGTVTNGGTTSIGNTFYLQSPGTLCATPGSSAGSDPIASAGGTNHDGTPTQARVYEIRGLTGTYDPTRQTQFTLFLDAGTQVANGTQARVSYDFNGDGVYDRIETYRYFAEDNRVGWESYTQAAGLKSATGSFANLQSGSVKLEVWNAIGKATVSLRTDASVTNGQQSVLQVPFTNLTRTTATNVVPTPTLNVSPMSLALGTTTLGAAGSAQTFPVSGSYLTTGLVVSAPAGVQLSTDGKTYVSTLNLTRDATGTMTATTIYTRIAASASVGTITGVITLSSTSAAAKQVTVSGTVTAGGVTPIGSTLYILNPGVLSATPGTIARGDAIGSAGGTNHDGTPTNALVYEMRGLTGSYDPAQHTQFTLFLDAGTQHANGTQIRISYDFNGDGVYDRVETYCYYAEDDRIGWEMYTETAGLRSATGTFDNFNRGNIKVEIWNAIGQAPVSLRTDASASDGRQSVIRIPFTNVTQSHVP